MTDTPIDGAVTTSFSNFRREQMALGHIAPGITDDNGIVPLQTEALKEGPEGGNSGVMEPASKEYVDLSLAKAMAEVRGEFAMLNQRMGDLEKRMPSVWAIFAAAFSATATGVAILLATLAFGGDRFDSGLSLAEQRQEQLDRDRQQDETLKRLDAIITRLDAQSVAPATLSNPADATSGN